MHHYPRLPEASVDRKSSGIGDHSGRSKKYTPSQEGRKSCHHFTSNLHLVLRRMYRHCLLECPFNKSSKRCMNVHPSGTTAQAWLNLPTSHCSSFNLHHRLADQSSNMQINSASLSAGKRAVMLTESNSIPKKVKHVVGPTHSSGDKGIPISAAD